MYYSYDVFDTCLIRAFGKPSYLFDLLAYRILGSSASLSERMDFSQIRKRGEQLALKKYQEAKEDVTLSEIYEQCDFSMLTPKSNNDIMEQELALEEEFLLPVSTIKKEISTIHEKGYSIIFISDMYLPSSFLCQVLRKHGLFKEGDSIYVSGEIGLTKRSGRLYDYVRKRHKIVLWKHSGDNRKSDFIEPLRKGIISRRVKPGYTYYERKLMSKDISLNESPLQISASISRSVLNEEGYNSRTMMATDIMAPLYVSFVYKMMKDAHSRGITTLYFAARDAYPLYEIAKSLNPLFKDIDLKYLFISRKSTYLPSLSELSKDEVSRIYNRLENKSLDALMDILKLNLSFLSDKERRDLSLLNGENLINALFQHPRFEENLNIQKNIAEGDCLGYLVQEGLGGGNAIVDLRGTRASLSGINAILKRAGYNGVYSYYFEVINRILSSEDPYCSLLYSERYQNWNRYVHDAAAIMEEYFSASNQYRTEGYECKEGKFKPVFEINHYDDINLKANIGCINISCCKKYAELFMRLHLYEHSEILLAASVSLLSDFMKKPHKDYLKSLINYRISDSKNDTKFVIQRFIYKRNQTNWTRGSLYYLWYTILNPFYSNKS